MDSLFLLQYTCFIFMLLNAIFIVGSRIHVKWVNKRYELSRWMICLAYLGLAIQYLGQMIFGFRTIGDELGAIVNILIYTPCFSLIALAIYNLEAKRSELSKMGIVCGCLYLAIVITFGIVLYKKEHLRTGVWLYAMMGLFGVSVIYCIVMIVKGMVSRKQMLEMMAASDMLPFVRWSRVSIIILLLPAFAIPFVILFTSMLYIVGPLGLLAVIFFNLTFIALGNSYTPTEELLDNQPNVNNDQETLTPERENEIKHALSLWVDGDGYKDSSANMLTLSRSVNISKNDLTKYFDQSLNITFRLWLSDIRFNAAKKMMIEIPDYSNDAISEECGFSSRSHLYRIFKAREGCTPADWRKSIQSVS